MRWTGASTAYSGRVRLRLRLLSVLTPNGNHTYHDATLLSVASPDPEVVWWQKFLLRCLKQGIGVLILRTFEKCFRFVKKSRLQCHCILTLLQPSQQVLFQNQVRPHFGRRSVRNLCLIYVLSPDFTVGTYCVPIAQPRETQLFEIVWRQRMLVVCRPCAFFLKSFVQNFSNSRSILLAHKCIELVEI